MKQLDRFIMSLPNMEPVEFIGLAKLLKVSTMEQIEGSEGIKKEDYAPRPFEKVLEDVLIAFKGLNRERKREIMKLMKALKSNKDSDLDASNSKDS